MGCPRGLVVADKRLTMVVVDVQQIPRITHTISTTTPQEIALVGGKFPCDETHDSDRSADGEHGCSDPAATFQLVHFTVVGHGVCATQQKLPK